MRARRAEHRPFLSVSVLGALGLQLLWAGFAHAQPAFDAQLVNAPPGALAGFTVPRAEPAAHAQVIWGAHLNFARSPLRLACLQAEPCDAAAQPRVALRRRSDLQLSIAAGLYDRIELGLALATAHVRGANVAGEWDRPASGLVATDLRTALKLGVLRAPVALSLWAGLSMPTGNQVRYAGEAGASVSPGVLVGYQLGPLHVGGQALLHLRRASSFGGLSLGNEVRLALAADAALGRHYGVFVESQARFGVGSGAGGGEARRPVESGIGLRAALADGLRARLGASTGAWPTPAGYGAPDYRLLLDLRGRLGPAPCQHGPEDLDGFRDDDRCADPDNDGDGLLDADDRCPNDAEDIDGFADGDGCPDPDNDADGLLDAEDRCPLRSEDGDGFEDGDGCPELDNDADGSPDSVDRCPLEPEDADGFADGDGCPEPGPEPLSVTVTDSRLLLSDRIHFEFGTDELRAHSLPLLDEVARAAAKLSPGRVLRIEAHTAGLGDPAHGRQLSERRARRVLDYLVTQGVPRARLIHRGMGAEKPLVKGTGLEAQALNRRVEFRVSPTGSRRDP